MKYTLSELMACSVAALFAGLIYAYTCERWKEMSTGHLVSGAVALVAITAFLVSTILKK
jgi:hypothetical protein